jgi:hypothetical protein
MPLICAAKAQRPNLLPPGLHDGSEPKMKNTTQNMIYYYHAGVQYNDSQTGEVCMDWSDHTRRTQETAEIEAMKLARKFGEGGKPIVEFWAKEHGLRPGWDCAAGAYDVTP